MPPRTTRASFRSRKERGNGIVVAELLEDPAELELWGNRSRNAAGGGGGTTVNLYPLGEGSMPATTSAVSEALANTTWTRADSSPLSGRIVLELTNRGPDDIEFLFATSAPSESLKGNILTSGSSTGLRDMTEAIHAYVRCGTLQSAGSGTTVQELGRQGTSSAANAEAFAGTTWTRADPTPLSTRTTVEATNHGTEDIEVLLAPTGSAPSESLKGAILTPGSTLPPRQVASTVGIWIRAPSTQSGTGNGTLISEYGG